MKTVLLEVSATFEAEFCGLMILKIQTEALFNHILILHYIKARQCLAFVARAGHLTPKQPCKELTGKAGRGRLRRDHKYTLGSQILSRVTDPL